MRSLSRSGRNPGDSLSRVEKRAQLKEELYSRVRAIAAEERQLDTDLARNAITRQQRDDGKQRLALEARANELGDREGRPFFVSHGYTFYDEQGAIAPGEPYLIALRSVDGNSAYYILEEQTATGSIYWGELADDVQTELEKLIQRSGR